MNSNKKSISLQEKLKILEDLENNKSSSEIFKIYGINKSTLYKIKQNKEKIENFATNSVILPKTVKRIKGPGFPEIEKRLYTWFLAEREKKNTINDQLLKIKALDIHKQLGLSCDFSASQGFISNFKKRHGIRMKKISGEKLSCADEAIIKNFQEAFTRQMEELMLVPEQIYNADETALVYKNLDNRTLVTVNEKTAPGRKNSKDRVTIMPCCNATGSHKLTLMMIGKSEKPRPFKNWDNMLYYKASKNSWQTTSLFKNWFFDQFVPSVRHHLKEKNLPEKAILLIDNCTAHGTETMLRTDDGNFKVMFLPPNTTAILQPLDQQIIKSMKLRYQKNLLLDLASKPGSDTIAKLKQINLKDVSIMIHQAWMDVPISVIRSGWKVLIDIDINNLNLPVNHFDDDDDLPLATLYNNVASGSLLSSEDIMDWATGATESLSRNFDESNLNEEENDENTEGEYDVNDDDDNTQNIDQIIQSFNNVIEWSENENLPMNDILNLRRIRNKAVMRRLII